MASVSSRIRCWGRKRRQPMAISSAGAAWRFWNQSAEGPKPDITTTSSVAGSLPTTSSTVWYRRPDFRPRCVRRSKR
jgi:hypothetical protein